MAAGGHRPGAGRKAAGGRPEGTINPSTQAAHAAFEEARKALCTPGSKRFEGNALQFMQAVYQNPDFGMTVRMDAARTAIKFETPALSTVDINAIAKPVNKLSDAELRAYLESAMRAETIANTVDATVIEPSQDAAQTVLVIAVTDDTSDD